MAGTRIRGITIELSGDASKLNESLNSVNKALKNTQSQLKDVDKLLKLDPKNTELLQQKQGLLSDAIAETKTKIDEEKKALEALKASPDADKTIEQQRALERDIIATTQSLDQYQQEADETSRELAELNGAAKAAGDSIEENAEQAKSGAEKLDEFGNRAQAVADKTKALSAAAAVLGAALLTNAYKSAQAADDLNTLSKQTGFSVEELQKMQYASDLVDVSMDTMTGSIKKLTSKMSSGAAVFDELGVSIYDADGNMRDATEVWYDSLEALSKVENETERDALSMELFGKSAMDMAGIVDDGGAALKELGQEAEDAGLILGQDGVDAANEFNDAMDKLKARTQGALLKAGATLAKVLAPALEKIVTAVTKVVSWFANLDGKTQKLILAIVGLVAAISPVAAILSKIGAAVNVVKTAFTLLSGPIGIVVAAIAAAVAIGILLYKNWDTIKAKAQELWQNITATFEAIKKAITEKVTAAKNAVTEKFEAIRGSMAEKIESAKNAISDKFNSIKTAISEKIGAIRSSVSETFQNIVYAMTHPIETARDTISAVIEKIKGFFSGEWSLPKIKVPHFSVSGGVPPWGIGGYGTKPTISVDWYAKAMRNGLILNNPTIFGMNNGALLGAGEAGSETIVGTNNLMAMIKEAAASSGPVINMTVNGAGMSAEEIANIAVDKITTTIRRNNQRW